MLPSSDPWFFYKIFSFKIDGWTKAVSSGLQLVSIRACMVYFTQSVFCFACSVWMIISPFKFNSSIFFSEIGTIWSHIKFEDLKNNTFYSYNNMLYAQNKWLYSVSMILIFCLYPWLIKNISLSFMTIEISFH